MEVDTEKDIQFYSHLIEKLGPEADLVAQEIFADDFSWIGWEISQSEAPKTFFYKIVEVPGEIRLVHQRDLIDKKDILTKIDPWIRNGLEYLQMSRVRSRLIAAENGSLTTWLSPKKLNTSDPDYPLDQINIAQKIDPETIWVKQIQGNLIDLGENQSLEDLMLNIGNRDLGIDLSSGEEEVNLTEISKYVLALKWGLSADSLRATRAEILQETMPYIDGSSQAVLTSCGEISLNYLGSNKSQSWVKIDYQNREFKCDFCWRVLPLAWLNLHRCVC